MDQTLLYTQAIMHLMRDVHKGLMNCEAPKEGLEQLTMQQFQAVLFVHMNKKVSMSEIAQQMKITPASTTSMVDKLVKKNFLTRSSEPENRRTVFIALSDHAEEHFEKMMQDKLFHLSTIFAQLSEQDKQDLMRVLTHLGKLVDQHGKSH